LKQTTGACSGPCISYYIAAVVEALLFACTDEQEQASEDYGEWIKELVKLYEQVAFKLNRSDGPWMKLETAVPEDMKDDVKEARDEMAHAAGMCADKIPIVKFYSWSLWIKLLMHHGLFQKVPFEIQEKMAGFLDKSKKKSKLAEKLAPVMLRANRLTALFGWHYESFMWNCRDNCRPQMVAVRVAVNEFDNTSSIDRKSFRAAAKKRGAIKLVLDRFFVAEKSKYRDRIFDEIVKESVLTQEDMVFGPKKKGKKKKKVEDSDSDEEEESDSDEEEDVHQRYKSGEKEGECRKNCSGCHH
jgi:hypothetical protein